MRLYAVHVKPESEPVLMPEGFAWGAFFLGPLWLAGHRAWVAAGLSLAAYVVTAALAPPWLALILFPPMALLLGLHGHDLVGWALDHRGYTLIHVVAGRRQDDAWMRLLAYRPDLAARLTADLP